MTTPSREPEQNLADATESPAPVSVAVAASRAAQRFRVWLILTMLAVAMVAQLWSSVTQLSITSDEADHLHAAYRYWQCSDFGWNPEHPPLVKIVAGVPLQAMHINDPIPQACGLAEDKATDFALGHEFVFANAESMLTAARFAVSLFAVLLLIAVWCFARKMFGLPAAVIAGVLLAFEPNILAHGALVTTDTAAALGFLLAVYALYCYGQEPSPSRLLVLGLAIGVALCTKYSTVLLAVILPALIIGDALLKGGGKIGRTLRARAGALLAAGAIAMAVVWACYGFRYTARPAGAAIAVPPKLVEAHGTTVNRILPQLENWRIAPEAYLIGLQDVMAESEVGRAAFILGKLYRQGRWFYFPVAAAIKFTLPLLVMLLISAFSWHFWKDKRRELLYLVLPVLIYFSISMTSKLNMGIRHLLPVLPFLIIFAAAGAWNLTRKYRWARIATVALLVSQAISSLHAFPNYLSYSNELWGGPANTYRYLANSDVDWGQAQKMARAYIDKTHPPNCFFLRTYDSKNSDYGIPCGGISEMQRDVPETPYAGTMIVSSTMVNGVGVGAVSSKTPRVFKDLKPVAKLGGSALLVYQGTFDVSPIAAAQLLTNARRNGGENPQLALETAKQAVALDPGNGEAHIMICTIYQMLGQVQKAEEECNAGLALVLKDPQYGPEQVKRLEDFITKRRLSIYSSSSTP